MAGRAGRRGMDDFGRVYLRINPKQVRAEQVKNCVYGEAQPVLSQFNASYATLLNLYDKHGEDVISIYPDTLNYFQSSKRQRRLERQKFLDRLQVLKRPAASGTTPSQIKAVSPAGSSATSSSCRSSSWKASSTAGIRRN